MEKIKTFIHEIVDMILVRCKFVKQSFNISLVVVHIAAFVVGVIFTIFGGPLSGADVTILQLIGIYIIGYCFIYLIAYVMFMFSLTGDEQDMFDLIKKWIYKQTRLNKSIWVYSFIFMFIFAIDAILNHPGISKLADFATLITVAVIPPFLWAWSDDRKVRNNIQTNRENLTHIDTCINCTKMFKWQTYENIETKSFEPIEIECPWCEEGFGKIRNQNISGIAVFKVSEEKAHSKE